MSKSKFTKIYCLSLILPFLLLIFPLFSIGNRATPIIMGMPFSIFWVILWIIITFLIVLILYRIDPDKDEEEVH
ncbi:DUF3311 domain-containing protein [Rossellomorea aquimaris]|jgi:hypothetical protein|uniref:DUF3311 domain-containing protein n=1 Tax=Rossellomorea aquimaris TaxID=189382 RepID=A0A5D4U407_9BACI|nr:DUF3311 domain-containing protein [Rossellomorea aquimaris]TYS81998.1 DUF3311 domain-containing protein [Rossellomorea aquimaris]TYS88621.1 DUF3311 domain-containing protein [Rossellomorea aquimaris]TYS89698.1 DUF3311 domain-containing protein [Rossellomorea aquimaris]